MEVRFIVAGLLRREYLLPPVGHPLLDAPGGNLLYTAGGLRIWESEIGLLGRVGEDYPFQWRRDIEARGFDMQGLKILPHGRNLFIFGLDHLVHGFLDILGRLYLLQFRAHDLDSP